jgi:hypothetical protein
MLFGEQASASTSGAHSPELSTSVPTGLRPTELAYLAGFFDGEGSIGVAGGSLCVRITNTYRPILERFKTAFGGTIDVHSTGDEKSRLSWVWRCYGTNAENALIAMEPMLVEKGPQAYLGLHFRELPKGHARTRVVEALGLLKKTTHHRS